MVRKILAHTDHRPWPLPKRPWIGAMRWHELLFAHWPVRPAVLRPFVPIDLAIDTYDGWAWIGIVPFRMTGVRPRFVPPALGIAFPELNVRTYVRSWDRSGVWFFSLDATSKLAVRGARRTFGLPYYDAEIACENDNNAVHYKSRRVHPDAPPAELSARYEPTGPAATAEPGSLDHFLTERYALFSVGRHGLVRVVDIHHPPWKLQPATAEIESNTMAEQLRIQLPDRDPVLHYADFQEVAVWPMKRLRDVDGRR